MGLFAIACGVVIAAKLLVVVWHPDGLLMVPSSAWLAVLALLGVWFIWILYLSV